MTIPDQLISDSIRLLPLFVVVITGLVQMILATTRLSPVTVTLVSLAGYLIAAILLATGGMPTGDLFNGFVRIESIGWVGSWVVLLIACLHTLIVSRSGSTYSVKTADFLALQAFAVAGMLMLIWSGDLITVFIGVETMSIPFYVMAGINRKDIRSNEAAMKYFLIGAFAGGFLLYGIALIYGATGSTSLTVIREFLENGQAGLLYWLGLALVLVGFLFKISGVPFHFWAPDVYQGAPSASSAFLATAGKVASFTGLAVIGLKLAPPLSDKWIGILAVVSGLSMIAGNLTALPQSSIKRMLGFSSVAHAGYILLGFLSQSGSGFQAVGYYLLVYAVTNFAAFAVVMLLETDPKGLSVDGARGLGYRRPLESAILAITMFSLLGIPPLGGFVGKYLIFIDAWQAGYYSLVILAVITSAISAGFYLRVVVALYQPVDTSREPIQGSLALVSVCLAVVIILVTGIWPAWPSGLLLSAW